MVCESVYRRGDAWCVGHRQEALVGEGHQGPTIGLVDIEIMLGCLRLSNHKDRYCANCNRCSAALRLLLWQCERTLLNADGRVDMGRSVLRATRALRIETVLLTTRGNSSRRQTPGPLRS